MPLASTLTDVANLSLASIGEVLIENIDDQTGVSRAINRVLYESIRQTQLEIFWEDLIAVFEPAQLTDPYPGSDELYQYNMPTTFLDVVNLKSGAHWFLSGGKLITDDPAPVVTYKRYSDEPSEWSGYLVELVYRRVAANVAMTLTQNTQITQMASQAYQDTMTRNLTRSSNRSRKNSFRDRGFGNMRSRISRIFGHGRSL
jgi:hypothetical protein